MRAIDGTSETDVMTEYQLPSLSFDLDVSFLYADDIETIEHGAAAIGRTSDLLALVQGIAIIRIERDGLWLQSGYKSLGAYRVAQAARLNMPRSSISHRRRIAEQWIKHRKMLAKVSLEGNVTKLKYLDDALALHENKREVLAHFKNDTFDEWVEYARPKVIEPEFPDVQAEIDDSGVRIDGKAVIAWGDDLSEREKQWTGEILKRAYRARAGGCKACVLSVYDDGEARALELYLKKIRSKK